MTIPWWWVLLALWMAPGAVVAIRAFRRSLASIAIGTLPEEGEPPPHTPRWWERPLLLLILPIPLTFFLVALLVFALLYPAVCAVQSVWRKSVGNRHAP